MSGKRRDAMTVDFVRPMGVPPVREPRQAGNVPGPQTTTQSAGANDRPVAPDPVRGNLLDVRG
jgi:hypothetical protein